MDIGGGGRLAVGIDIAACTDIINGQPVQIMTELQ